MAIFPKLMTPRKRIGVDIGEMINCHNDVFFDFFSAKKSVDADELIRILAEGGLHKLTDPDLEYIVGQLKSFPKEQALRFFYSYVFGMQPEFVAAMNADEMKTFAKGVEGALSTIHGLILSVGMRVGHQLLGKHIDKLVDSHACFLWAMHWMIKMYTMSRALVCTGVLDTIPVHKQLQEFDNYGRNAKIVHIIELLGDMCEKKYPTLHMDDQAAIARVVREFPTRSAFEVRVWQAFRSNREFVASVLTELELMLPQRLAIVTDSVSIANNSKLAQSFSTTMSAIRSASGFKEKS